MCIRDSIRGVKKERIKNLTRVEVGAGENWQGFVRFCLGQGLGHLANLSLIPGTVGAAPIQNIGAYGVEVASYIEAVQTVDRVTGAVDWMPHGDCCFGYRDSIFRRRPDDFVISRVRFCFPDDPPLNTGYAGIEQELHNMGVVQASAVQVAEAVCRIRRRKLPDPKSIQNAGSFFKNPQLTRTQFAEHSALLDGIPNWPVDTIDPTQAQPIPGVKLSAAALIEQAVGVDRRVSDQPGVYPWRLQPLVLVHRGGCDGVDVLRVASEIAAAVHQRFAVTLEIEPRLLGAAILGDSE